MRTVKYGETSLIVTVFTELFGVQSYMVNVVRSVKKSASITIGHLQPGNLLDMVVYHHERATLQRIKDCRLVFHGLNLDENMSRNAVLLFIVELLQKCLKQPDPHPELFYFLEDVMSGLNDATPIQTANIPLFFMLHLSHFFGFRLMDNFNDTCSLLDLHEGQFVDNVPIHNLYLEKPASKLVAGMLRVMQITELEQFHLNRQIRNELIDRLSDFYALHVQPFGSLKSLPVLRTIWAD
jgi:DNA repair protein RecO (recombination protein O)